MKKIIMILTNGFYSDPRVYKEAEYYIAQGCEVEILCWDRDCKYDIDEIRDGIKIHRFHIKSKYGSGLKKQLRAYLKFRKSCLKYLKNQNYDILHCHDLDGALVGLKVRKKIVKIFDMHEYYLVYENKLLNFIFGKIVRRVQNKFDYIIYLNDKQKKDIRKNNLNKLIFLPNYPEDKVFGVIQKNQSDLVRIGYAGAIRSTVAFEYLFNAVQNTKNIVINLYGRGVTLERLKKYADEKIKFYGEFEYEQLQEIYRNTDVVFCVYDDLKNDTYPVKFLEALITHTPVIVNKNSITSKLVYEYDIGFTVDIDNSESFAEVINTIDKDPQLVKEKEKNYEELSEKLIWEDVVVNLKTGIKDKIEVTQNVSNL